MCPQCVLKYTAVDREKGLNPGSTGATRGCAGANSCPVLKRTGPHPPSHTACCPPRLAQETIRAGTLYSNRVSSGEMLRLRL